MGWRILERAERLADSATALLGNRLSLFGLEVQEELERWLGHLALLLGVAVLGFLALLCATAVLLILAAGQGVLLQVALGLCGVFGALGVLGGLWLYRRVQQASLPFAATRAEFGRDHACLQGYRGGRREDEA